MIATLLMVESPSATLYVPVSNDDDSKSDNSDEALENVKLDPELVMIKEAPITSSISTAEKHLVERAGKLSRFRGISIAMVINIVTMNVAQLVASVLPSPLQGLAFVVAQVAVTPLSMAWTHIVISEPSTKSWYSRIPSFSASKKVVGPTIILAVAEQVSIFLPLYLATFWGLDKISPEDVQEDQINVLLKIMAVLVVAVAASVLVVIPANVTLTRVQASLLSEEDETIVPFDRSFGGRVVPEVLGGSGMIGLLDAWKTFDFNSRIRLIKLYAQVWLLQMRAMVIFVVALVGFFAIVAA